MNCSSCGTALPQGSAHCPKCQQATPAENGPSTVPDSSSQDAPARKPRLQKTALKKSRSKGQRLSLPQRPVQPVSTLEQHTLTNTSPDETSEVAPEQASATIVPTSTEPQPSHPEVTNTTRQRALVHPTPMPLAVFRGPATKIGTNAVVGASSKAHISKNMLILCLAICIVIGGMTGVVALLNKSTTETTSTAPVVIPTDNTTASIPANAGPSGAKVQPAAAALIIEAHTSSSINDKYIPTHLTKIFPAKQTIYITFVINSPQQSGTIMVKWYENGKQLHTDTLQHSPPNNVAFFSEQYEHKANGSAELYWCTQESCQNAQLAQVLTFTVLPSLAD